MGSVEGKSYRICQATDFWERPEMNALGDKVKTLLSRNYGVTGTSDFETLAVS